MALGSTVPNLSSLKLKSVPLNDRAFGRLCRDNPEFRFELTASGDLIVMTPTGAETGQRNAKLTARLVAWAEETGSGVVFDSSTGFTLPNGAKRSPDASWVSLPKWSSLSPREQQGFAPLCPEFVVELRSPGDDLKDLLQKMEEYVANGTQLGWLIDPQTKRVHVYRPAEDPRILKSPRSVSADPLLPGFRLDLTGIW